MRSGKHFMNKVRISTKRWNTKAYKPNRNQKDEKFIKTVLTKNSIDKLKSRLDQQKNQCMQDGAFT